MTVTYRFVIDHLDDPARKTEAQTFAQAFSEYRDGGTWFFLIPSKQVATAAQTLLRTLSVQWQMVYHLRLDAEDLDAYPAFFPGIPAYYGLIDADKVVEKKLRKNTIVKDLESGRIIVSREWKQLCEPRCRGLSFDAVSGDRG
ncbi:MAG: hypothetical protein MJA82_16545, partial [Clostridia bacterium]|nr:hypothetical protein [Clostridia bacterium]